MAAAGGRISTGLGVSLLASHAADRNPEATVFIGNVDAAATEALLWELAAQAGPVSSVHMPKDRVTGAHQGYAFVEFAGEADAEYAIKALNMVRLHGKPLRVNRSAQDRDSADVGANLFVGNLDPDVDEKTLHDTFAAFGVLVDAPHVARDPETGLSRGFGFVSYDCFAASDAAVAAMDGQFLANRTIAVQYAFKKDSRGERHGTPAERLLAEQFQARGGGARPHTRFAAGPPGSKEEKAGGGAGAPLAPPPAAGGWGAPPPRPGWGGPPPPPPGSWGGPTPPAASGMPPPGWGGPPPPMPPPGWGGPPPRPPPGFGFGGPPPPPPPDDVPPPPPPG